MNSISSRYRKPKGRPNKRRKAIQAVQKKLKSSLSSAFSETNAENMGRTSDSSAKPDNNCAFENDSPVTSTGYIIISETAFSSLLRNVPCNDCGMCSLTVKTRDNYGYSVQLELLCQACGKSFGSTFSSDREPYSRKFDLNNKLVGAFLRMGKGHSAMENFSMALGAPAMNRKTFAKYLDRQCEMNNIFKRNMLEVSCDLVRKAHIQSNPNLRLNDMLDITVSYDGTWHKRGHTSLYGIGIVIDSLTNLVVDYEILSKYCHDCTTAARDLGEMSAEYHFWKQGHECQKNFSGSSGSMEMHAALKLWERSVTKNRMKYTTIISDGDSRAFHALSDKKFYGPDVVIQKEECINHVAKRLGTGLRNKIKEWRAKGVTLGGRKKGSLTEATIIKLQNFYRKAIKDNAPDLEKMKTSVLATLFHCMSTNKKPQHNKCPKGESSWCFYKRAKACNETPQSHTHMKTQLSEEVVAKIFPVYQRLASEEILLRCVSGQTQNANESLHSCIWNKCPKEVFVSKKRLELAVSLAVSEFNLGCRRTLEISEGKHFIPSKETMNLAERRNNRRLYQRKRRSSEAFKKIQNRKCTKKMRKDNTYNAGAF